MTQIDKDRFFSMAKCYDKMAQMLVPQYDFLQGEVFNIIDFDYNAPINVIDLGAGSGLFLEKILKKYPNSKCYYIDYSKPFLEVAKERLRDYEDRITFILASIEGAWEKEINTDIDLVVSMSAIHHLENVEKKMLYNKIYTLLNKNGWFINIDEMKTVYFDAYRRNMVFWSDYINESKKNIPKNLLDDYNSWNISFDNWRKRNIEHIKAPKVKGDDIHQFFLKQLKWLHKIGFKGVDIYMKYHLWCIIGGQKQEN